MKFSIIIPTMNAQTQLHITLDSLVKQTYSDFECILIDGGSSDSTQTVASHYDNQLPNLQFYSRQDKGIYDAMNIGVSYATGDYILFLGAGDRLHDEMVLANVNEILTHTVADVIYGDILYLPDQIIRHPSKLSNRFFSSGKMICHQSIIARRETLLRHPFNLNFRFGADRDWLIKTFRDKAVIIHMPLVIADFDTSGFTNRPENRKAVWMESGKILKQYYGFIMVPITFIKYYLFIKWRT